MANGQEDQRLKAFIDLEEPSHKDEIMEWAKENINEDPDKRDNVISSFRDLIFAKGECTPHRTDDPFLLRFLRARHFVIERAHKLMVNYYDFKENNPQYFEDINLDRLRELSTKDIIGVPPYKDQLGRRIMILRIGTWDTSEFTVDELIQLIIAIVEFAIMEPHCQIKGGILIFDFSDLAIRHVWQLTPTIANHIIQLCMTCFPLRLEAVHIIFQSWVFDMGFNVIKPLLNEAMRERIFFHGDDMESFHTHVDPKYLPKRYGGVHLDYPVEIWFDDFLKHNGPMLQELKDLGYKDIFQLKEERKNNEND